MGHTVLVSQDGHSDELLDLGKERMRVGVRNPGLSKDEGSMSVVEVLDLVDVDMLVALGVTASADNVSVTAFVGPIGHLLATDNLVPLRRKVQLLDTI